ncbi:MAG TPA: rod-binding protein [Dongiaceae bacterium]|jgi:Rod binding domain-containing protein|nr:rod-binding protein [Dongiaceae bacterium]
MNGIAQTAADPRALAQYRAAQALNQAQPGGRGGMKLNEAGIEKVAEDFEAFFAGTYFEQMFSGIQPDPVTGGGEGEEMFRSLMLQEYGKAVARQHKLGIADIVKSQLLRLQEAQQETMK